MKNIIPKPIPWFAVLYIAFATTLIYFYFQIQSLNRQLAALTLPPVIPTSIPEESIIPEEEEFTPVPTTKPSSVINISYSLPAGWTEAKLEGSSLSVGYDPANTSINQNSVATGLVLRKQVAWPSNFPTPNMTAERDTVFIEKPYNGGSRHTFINQYGAGPNSSFEKMPVYHEKEYRVNGKNCLFLIGVELSQYPNTWGMCALSNSRAVLISIETIDDSQVESILKTVKFSSL